jgi:hypothetical protein
MFCGARVVASYRFFSYRLADQYILWRTRSSSYRIFSYRLADQYVLWRTRSSDYSSPSQRFWPVYAVSIVCLGAGVHYWEFRCRPYIISFLSFMLRFKRNAVRHWISTECGFNWACETLSVDLDICLHFPFYTISASFLVCLVFIYFFALFICSSVLFLIFSLLCLSLLLPFFFGNRAEKKRNFRQRILTENKK